MRHKEKETERGGKDVEKSVLHIVAVKKNGFYIIVSYILYKKMQIWWVESEKKIINQLGMLFSEFLHIVVPVSEAVSRDLVTSRDDES